MSQCTAGALERTSNTAASGRSGAFANTAHISSPYSARKDDGYRCNSSSIEPHQAFPGANPRPRAHLTSFAIRVASALATAAPERRDAVITAALIVQLGGRAFLRFDHQPLLQHSLDGTVQRPGAQLEFAAGSSRDILNNRVAVPVFLGHRHQNVKGGGGKGRIFGLRGFLRHGTQYIHSGYIVNGYIGHPRFSRPGAVSAGLG